MARRAPRRWPTMPPLWIEPGIRLPLGRSTVLPEGTDPQRIARIEALLRERGFRLAPGGSAAPPKPATSPSAGVQLTGVLAERYTGALPASETMRRTMGLLMVCGGVLAATEYFLTSSVGPALLWILGMGGLVVLFWVWVGRGCESDLVGAVVEWRPGPPGNGPVWGPKEIRWRAGRVRSEVRIGGRIVAEIEAPPELVDLLVALTAAFEASSSADDPDPAPGARPSPSRPAR
ncbi:MAG: hypothetical protein ACYCPN_02580 [Thermoplasmata archaeon]